MNDNFFFSIKKNKSFLFFLCVLERFFSIIKINLINEALFFNIKKELFYIDGACQNSGVCCRGLGIKFKGKFIDSSELYEKLISTNSNFKRFIPHFDDKQISHFSCSSLSVNNLCTDYENRPNICKKYPFSVFYSEDYIREGCGYFVRMKQELPRIASVKLKQKVQCIKYNTRCKI
mgnify:CR=1 FL=1|tara:strand:+ start:3445 stop:3972 length:528 start_codon:yes stop_codon:yes gene_type:complete